MIVWLLTGLGGYLLGAFPSGVLVSRLWRHQDIREHGSGNPGATNVLKILGPVPGAIVFILDAGKGLLAVFLPARFLAPEYAWLSGLLAIVGHIYPVYTGFRGGKGLATSCGAVGYLMPWTIAVFIPVWAAVYLWRRRMALASAAAIAAVAVPTPFLLHSWPLVVTLIGIGVIFWRHWPEARSDVSKRSLRCL